MLSSNFPPRVYLSPVHNTFHFIQGFPWFLFKLPSNLLPRIYLSPVHNTFHFIQGFTWFLFKLCTFQFSPKGLPESCSFCLLIFPPGFTWVLFMLPSTSPGFTWVLAPNTTELIISTPPGLQVNWILFFDRSNKFCRQPITMELIISTPPGSQVNWILFSDWSNKFCQQPITMELTTVYQCLQRSLLWFVKQVLSPANDKLTPVNVAHGNPEKVLISLIAEG